MITVNVFTWLYWFIRRWKSAETRVRFLLKVNTILIPHKGHSGSFTLISHSVLTTQTSFSSPEAALALIGQRQESRPLASGKVYHRKSAIHRPIAPDRPHSAHAQSSLTNLTNLVGWQYEMITLVPSPQKSRFLVLTWKERGLWDENAQTFT